MLTKHPRQLLMAALLVLTPLLMTGCATTGSLKLIDPKHPVALANLQHWQLEARVAIRTPEDSITASLNWQKNQSEFDFLLTGAFGVTLAHLVQQKDQASLDIPDRDTLLHFDAETLLQQTLGWDFPIDALAYWVKGLPSGNPSEIVKRNPEGIITNIQMGFWQIDFSKYRDYQGYRLPRMIKAEHPNMSIKVVAKQWAFYQ